jgi:predicted RND superfamily exporter protein
MIFIGYMVISSVQLGATIDYAILMTNYYLEGRRTMMKRDAAEYASEKAGTSILISSLVFGSAGFTISGVFTQEAMAQLGMLIGRGALLSGAMAILVLPQLLMLLDGVIQRTTLQRPLLKGRK